MDEIINCLGRIVVILQKDTRQALKELRRLGAAIDDQVPYRDGHSLRVTDYALAIAEHLDFSEDEKLVLELAALLHDFGKIGIDEAVLVAPRKLTAAEKAEVDMHVMRGYHMLAGFNELNEALRGVKFHHEFYDGTGYPEGLARTQIPLIARIIAVADAYDAMTSVRPYRRALTSDEAVAELRKNAGTQFDPAVVRILVRLVLKKKRA